MPTIKELSDVLGMSKPTVKRKLQDLGLWDGHVNKTGTTFSVDDYAASVLSREVDGAAQAEDRRDDVAHEGVVDSLNRYIASLERQLEAKDGQIAALIEQNGELSEKLDVMGDRLTGLAEQVARANALAERPHGLWDRLLGPGRD